MLRRRKSAVRGKIVFHGGKSNGQLTINNGQLTISFALGEINCPLLIVNYQLSIVNCLKFLSDDKVEIASASLRAAVWAVETVGPVDTHQPDHREEDADADAGRPFQVERIEVFQVRPCVTGFDEDQSVDGRRRE